MPETTRPLVVAATEQANRIDERFDGYRALLIQHLAAVIRVQEDGGSNAMRRSRVEKQVAAAADVVTAKTEGAGS